jgi:hypothetical protein
LERKDVTKEEFGKRRKDRRDNAVTIRSMLGNLCGEETREEMPKAEKRKLEEDQMTKV